MNTHAAYLASTSPLLRALARLEPLAGILPAPNPALDACSRNHSRKQYSMFFSEHRALPSEFLQHEWRKAEIDKAIKWLDDRLRQPTLVDVQLQLFQVRNHLTAALAILERADQLHEKAA